MKMFGRTLLTLSLLGAIATGAQANDKVLRVYNWSDYIAPDTVKTVSYTHLTLPTILRV